MNIKALTCCVVAAWCVPMAGPACAGTEGDASTLYGHFAGMVNSEFNYSTFVGSYAGYSNTVGMQNVFVGADAGMNNTSGAHNSFFGTNSGDLNISGADNAFFGHEAGFANLESENTFIGSQAGKGNTSGYRNTFLGRQAGQANTTGPFNTFLGVYAGYANADGGYNTFLGSQTGESNVSGSGNVFIGNGAGYGETGSNRLYLDNCMNSAPCTPPFIYGEFDNHLLSINGVLHVAADNGLKSQLHFSRNNADSGGFLTSVLENNFFASSGARYSNGNWVQRSSDQQAVIAGSGGAGYRIFTGTGHAVGTTFTPTLRLHIDYGGNLGLNTAAVAGTPIAHSSGAHLTTGGVWTDASSREYKEHIEALSTEDAQRTLAALNPVRYNYKADPREKHVGFIAEDVPELVAREGRKSLSPMDIVAVLTKVLQEKSEKMDALEATVVRLEAELNRLKLRDAMARE